MNASVLLGLALKAIALYREARDRQAAIDATAKTGVEDDPNTPEREDWKSDAELADMLGVDSVQLQNNADALIEKWRGQ